MKINIRKAIIAFVILALVPTFYGCQSLMNIADAITNLERIKFKLDGVSNFRLMGIDIANKRSVNDFNLVDAANFADAMLSKTMMADFIVNVAAHNPNDGSGKTTSTVATLTSFDWKLYIDDSEVLAGDIASPIKIPGTGQTTIFPLGVRVDLMRFFGKQNLDNLLTLALALGGAEGSAARLTLDARPTIQTPFGAITYPGRIKIVNTEFRG